LGTFLLTAIGGGGGKTPESEMALSCETVGVPAINQSIKGPQG